MKTKKPSKSQNLSCTYCDKEFRYESEKLRHEASHIPHFECETCCKKFSFLSALRRHQKQHKRTICAQCNRCGRNFRDDTLLKRHMDYAHKGTFPCAKCEVKFNSEAALRTHMKTHKPESERKYRCSFNGCTKSFNFRHHLKHHELTHTDSKQHYCNVCGKGFIQAYNLKAHLRSHEPESWLYCPMPGCNKKYPTERARKRHLKTHKMNLEKSKSGCGENVYPVKTESPKILELEDDAFHHSEASEQSYDEDSFNLKNTESTNSIEELNINKFDNDFLVADENEVGNSFSDCKSAIGFCLASDGSEMNDCLCAKINTDRGNIDVLKSNDKYDNDGNNVKHKIIINREELMNVNGNPKQLGMNPEVSKESNVGLGEIIFVNNKNDSVQINNSKEKSDELLVNLEISVHKNMNSACVDCECSQICKTNNIKPRNNSVTCSNFVRKVHEMPKIETGEDGVIKIKETFDADIQVFEQTKSKPVETAVRDIGSVYSCRDVLGKCIVSGNGTMGEGCLCVRMAMDDQNMYEEIDEITPCPVII